MSISSQQLGDLCEMTGQPRIDTGTWRDAIGCVPKPSKYRAVRTVDADGTRWDSKAERRRWDLLCMLRDNGDIFDLVRQPKFEIIMNGVSCGFYRADFSYTDRKNERTIEDVKSAPTKTAVYRLKKKLVEAQYSIKITEIT